MIFNHHRSTILSNGDIRLSFAEVGVEGEKSGKCLCGKRRKRKERFSETINPFNKNPDGTIRTEAQIVATQKIKCDKWLTRQIYCEACRPKTYWEMSKKERNELDIKKQAATKDGRCLMCFEEKPCGCP